MQIDRSNYEVWVTDWLDGNLNSLQAEQLMLFLDHNQDLKEEFNDLTPINLASTVIPFHHKEDLKKSPADISSSQFDYLCAAYLENDLTDSQQFELKEIINADPHKKKTFDLIQNTILTPEKISYKHKNLLVRQTTVQKFTRLSVISLSAAAAISLIIIIYSVLPGTTTSKLRNSAHNLVSDSTIQSPSNVMADRIISDSIHVSLQKNTKNKSTGIDKGHALSANPDFKIKLADDSIAGKTDKQEIRINKVAACKQVDLGKEVVCNTLVASSQIIYIPDPADERSQVGKFISKTFREKILKEKTPHDAPLKGFEIAEAGVAGLNKLFGLEMALDMKNDENGQPRSVYFSSKILKVNAPVKKREVQP